MKSIGWKVAVIVAIALVALWSSQARALDEGWYAGFAVGRFWPSDTSTDGPKKALDPGLIGELRVGRRAPVATRWGLALEMAIGGFHLEGDMPPVDISETETQTLSAGWLATTFKGWHRLGHDRLRASAGLGLAYYRFDAGLKDPPSSRRDASETDLGAHFVGGVEVDVTRHFALGMEYRRLWVEATDQLGGNAAVYGASGDTALLGVLYRF